MCHVSAHGVDERMINVHYYYYCCLTSTETIGLITDGEKGHRNEQQGKSNYVIITGIKL